MAGKAAPKKNLSTLKRVKQSAKRKLRNQSAKTKIKTYVGKLEAAISSKDKDAMDKALREAVSVISNAASSGNIHKNTASRKVARISKKVATAAATLA
ncbi:MAG: 30S ribosomal protein S20 [Nitrospirales bacterium]|nr:30S ribosomal protein S20 [Nitrospirales bacterium]